ncbi:NACHT and WD repeat domain-containing protein [Streptomyces deccanensis]|uniref:NACHT and WD repeat domain-containing protein n=1 Tax=Streptomyces deccanensis TaxID=424188 RepID=UPI001EFB3AF9|nr:AAA family ATPase [Streptomyces deccanensis]ULR47853.1 AAA family ATPase [Streptomyces deccanensis]
MTDEHVPATYRRRLVVIAVSDYDDGTPTERVAFRDAINAQVSVVEDWWNSPHLDDQRRFTPSHPPKPLHSVHDLRAFLIDEDLISAHDDDALVIYLTGHGLAPADERHFLRLPDTHTERPLGTAFPTAELIAAALDSPAEHVLVMVDSCFSGRLTQELDRTLKALHPDRHALSSLVVLTAGNEDSRPRLRAFTTVLAAVHAHCADEANGYARSHLSWEDFDTILDTVWDATQMADVQVLWPPNSVSRRLAARELSPCLPNPGHTDTTLLEDARSQLGWTRRDVDAYWIDKATGQMSSDTGWYFTGRTALLARMNAFLAGSDSTLIVTGQAGSGKSALLARLVTLSDSRFCDDPTYRPYLEAIPEELRVATGAIDAAVLARNTDPQELHAALYQALTGQSIPSDENPSDLLHQHARTTLMRTDRPLTVVVDGIDEAKNPRRVITDVLRPLAGLRSGGQSAVRLILGIRSSVPTSRHALPDQDVRTERDLLDLLREATGALAPLRTDDDSAEDDIAAYAAALLRAPSAAGSRLTGRSSHAIADVAAAIAHEVTPSFLDARLAAQQLHARTALPAPSDPHWRRQLREGTQELLRQDLADVAQHTRTRPEDLLAVLRATAFALGAGMPWARVWPAAVRGLEPGCDAPDACIRVLRNSRLIGYLTTAVEDGRTVYRPIHERVSETLRTAPHTLLVQQPLPGVDDTHASDGIAAHRSLTEAFTRLLAEAPHQQPHPYLRRHLIAHAEAGDVLDDAHVPVSFLPFETHGRIRGTLGLPVVAQEATHCLAAWSRIEPFLADAPPDARADSLALAERAGDDQASRTEPPARRSPSLTARWNRLHLPGNILAGTSSDIFEIVTFLSSDGSLIVAAGHADGTVTMWDARTGLPFGAPFTQLGRFARALTVVDTRRRRPRLVAGTDAGLWRCDPETGAIEQLLSGRVRATASFVSPEHGFLLAVALPYATLTMDPYTGVVISQREADADARPSTVHALEAVPLPGGQVLLAIGTDGSRVPLLDAHTLKTVTELPGQGMGTSALQAFTTGSGELRLAIASRSGKGLRIFDPLSGRPQQRVRLRQSIASMTLYPRAYDEPLLALGSGVDGRITLISTSDGEVVHQLPTEHTKAVRGLAVLAESPGRRGIRGGRPSSRLSARTEPMLVSGSFDGTIRLWQPHNDDIGPEPMPDPSAQRIAMLPQPTGPARLISSNHATDISIHSFETGRPRPFPHAALDLPGHHITALATADHADRTWPGNLAVAYSDGSLHVLTDEGERTVLLEGARPGRRGRNHVRTLAFLPTSPPQSPVVVAGFSDSSLAYFPLDRAEGARQDIARADGPVRALAVSPAEAPLLLAVATRTIRLLHPRREPHARLPQRIGGVHSLEFIMLSGAPGLLLATGGADGAIRLWDPRAPRQALQVLSGHRGKVTALTTLHHRAFPQPLLVSASPDDTTVRVWECRTGEEILRLITAAPVTSLAVSADPRQEHDQPTIIFGSPRGIGAAAVYL